MGLWHLMIDKDFVIPVYVLKRNADFLNSRKLKHSFHYDRNYRSFMHVEVERKSLIYMSNSHFK